MEFLTGRYIFFKIYIVVVKYLIKKVKHKKEQCLLHYIIIIITKMISFVKNKAPIYMK